MKYQFEVSVYNEKAYESFYELTANNVHDKFKFGLRIVRPNTDKKVPVAFMVANDASKDGYEHRYVKEIVLEHNYALAMVDRTPATQDVLNADIQLWLKEPYNYDEYAYFNIYNKRKLDFPSSDLPIHAYMDSFEYAFKYGKIAIGAHCVRLAVSFVLKLGFANTEQLLVSGHSRDGKVSICAGVFDERIAIVAPHGSGCGGAALFKIPAKGVESLEDACNMWPSRMPAIAKFYNRRNEMPVDMHLARACVAPRAFFSTEGYQDFWSGPFSAYVGKKASEPVFDYFGAHHKNGIYLRQGGHDMTADDIENMLKFADNIFFGKNIDCDYANTVYYED